MYINTFKYTPKDVSCQLCTEYVKKLGCTALRCPWLAERIEAGVVGYHALLQAVWNKAETVYAYRADGKNALSLDYRSAELFKQRATLLYEDVGDSYIWMMAGHWRSIVFAPPVRRTLVASFMPHPRGRQRQWDTARSSPIRWIARAAAVSAPLVGTAQAWQAANAGQAAVSPPPLCTRRR